MLANTYSRQLKQTTFSDAFVVIGALRVKSISDYNFSMFRVPKYKLENILGKEINIFHFNRGSTSAGFAQA